VHYAGWRGGQVWNGKLLSSTSFRCRQQSHSIGDEKEVRRGGWCRPAGGRTIQDNEQGGRGCGDAIPKIHRWKRTGGRGLSPGQLIEREGPRQKRLKDDQERKQKKEKKGKKEKADEEAGRTFQMTNLRKVGRRREIGAVVRQLEKDGARPFCRSTGPRRKELDQGIRIRLQKEEAL